ncbi:MAG: hypothetical protein AAGG45_03240 [Pseudomonadota bacterium]
MKSSQFIAAVTAAIILCAGCETVADPDLTASNAVPSLEEGYTYPAPVGFEVVPTIVVDEVAIPSFEARVQFVSQLTQMLTSRPYAPLALAMTEGNDHQTIVFMDAGRLNVSTAYQARAMVAQMSSATRNSPVFAQYGVENYASVFDLFKLLGFDQVVITDGDDFAYAFLID